MKTRCKFKCDEVTTQKHWDQEKGFLYSVKMSPVVGGSEENKAFWAASPSGLFQLSCVTPNLFEPGKEYYLDITPAD
jgi:hypothetical protein